MKKYKLIDSDKKGFYRIKALRGFSSVKKGDIGGYIESEKNLSHDGDCWVYGDAEVSGNALVCGNAIVSGCAKVCGNAKVSGNALVCGNDIVSGCAKVCGNAKVSGSARVCGNAKVSGSARVYGNAKVSGSARVYGNAKVSGSARVYGNVLFFENATNKSDDPSNASDILDSSAKHLKDRAATYDKEGERSIPATVSAFNAITGHELTSEQGWLFMMLVKAVRSQHGDFKLDNYEDGAAYFALMGEQAYMDS